MHWLQGCSFAAFTEKNMLGSYNSNDYAESLRRNKIQSHNIKRSESTANKTHEIGKFRMSNKQSKKL